jgi:hypothetical protein
VNLTTGAHYLKKTHCVLSRIFIFRNQDRNILSAYENTLVISLSFVCVRLEIKSRSQTRPNLPRYYQGTVTWHSTCINQKLLIYSPIRINSTIIKIIGLTMHFKERTHSKVNNLTHLSITTDFFSFKISNELYLYFTQCFVIKTTFIDFIQLHLIKLMQA